MRNIFFFCFLLGLCCGGQGQASAEIKKVSIPDVQIAPSLKSVMSQRDSVLRKSSAAEETAAAAASVSTNGQFLTPDGTVIVDSLIEPKCVFYGNYNEGGGDAFQYIDVDTIIFECQ